MTHPKTGYTVLFDGTCPICLRSVQELKRLDRDGMLNFLSIRDPEVGGRFPSLSVETLESSMHLVGPDGQVREGADAVEALVGVLPGLSWLGWFFRIPLVRPLARRVYRWVARNRYRLTCRRHC